MSEPVRNTEPVPVEAARPSVLWRRPEVSLSLLLFVVIIGGWELLVWTLGIPMIVLPPPSAVIGSLWDTVATPSFAWNLGVTLYEILAGFGLGAVAGLLLGALIGQFPLLEKTLYPYVVGFQTIPKVALAPIIVIWLGFDTSSKVVITATVAFFPVLANTIAGLRAAPADQVELLTAFMGSPWQIFWKLRVPHAAPFIMVGVDVALMMAVIGAIVGEFVGAKAGLGYMILQKDFSMDMAGVFAILLVLSAIGIGLHAVVATLQRRLIFWTEGPRDPLV